MLNIITGRSGCGKSKKIISQISRVLSEGRRAFVLVPEQQSVITEKNILEALGNTSAMLCEVLNFERLPERVMRETGGVKEIYADRGGRILLMRDVLKELSPTLRQYKNTNSSANYVRKILDMAESFKRQAIIPETLTLMAKMTESTNRHLSDKLHDMALICARYALCFEGVLDPTDSISRLTEHLMHEPFFKGADVFVDGYYTFTGNERLLIAQLIKNADNLHITFCLGDDDFYVNQQKEFNSLCRFARENGIEYSITELTDDIRHKDETLSYIAKNIWNISAPSKAGSDTIRIYEADDPFSESAAAAAEILRLVKCGYRYKDIGVALRQSDTYRGVIDATLRRFGIPCSMNTKKMLSSKAVPALMLAACEMAASDLTLTSVKKYIKSPYCPLTRSESDVLDKYITVWDVRGLSSYKKEWTHNPRGYVSKALPADKKELAAVNTVREKLVSYILPLIEALRSKALTYASGSKALYEHLLSVGADERLYGQAQQYRIDGQEEECAELCASWDELMKLLEMSYTVGGSAGTDAQGFFESLRMMMNEYETGHIPAYSDEVQIGEASFMRFGELKALLVLGVNEGVFPSAPPPSGLFSDSELIQLSSFGFDAEICPSERLMQEQFIFCTTVSAPSERLSLFYPLNDLSGSVCRPSAAIGRVLRLFSDVHIRRPASDTAFLMQSEALAAEYSHKTTNSGTVRRSEQAKLPAGEAGRSVLSPSGIERYSLCPFMYYATDMLLLKETKKAEFDTSNAGTFVHGVLESFISAHKNDIRTVSDECIEKSVREYADEYLRDLSKSEPDMRLKNRFRRLCAMATEIIKNIRGEFCSSLFEPAEFEYRISGIRDGALKLNGVIDRVDTYTRDGITYVKVVDYKTGSKKLTLSSIANGLSLQILIYLFAYCEEAPKRVPAAVMYMPAIMPRGEDGKSAAAKLKRSGFVLAERTVTDALENPDDSVYMPYSVTSGGSYKKNSSSLLSGDEFDALQSFVTMYIEDVARRINDGAIPVSPLETSGVNGCEYCKMRMVCRRPDDVQRKCAELTPKLSQLLSRLTSGEGSEGV